MSISLKKRACVAQTVPVAVAALSGPVSFKSASARSVMESLRIAEYLVGLQREIEHHAVRIPYDDALPEPHLASEVECAAADLALECAEIQRVLGEDEIRVEAADGGDIRRLHACFLHMNRRGSTKDGVFNGAHPMVTSRAAVPSMRRTARHDLGRTASEDAGSFTLTLSGVSSPAPIHRCASTRSRLARFRRARPLDSRAPPQEDVGQALPRFADAAVHLDSPSRTRCAPSGCSTPSRPTPAASASAGAKPSAAHAAWRATLRDPSASTCASAQEGAGRPGTSRRASRTAVGPMRSRRPGRRRPA